MTTENNNIDNILGLHFSRERLSDEQEIILIEWISKNKDEYHKLSEVFESSGASDNNGHVFDTDRAWENVSRNIRTQRTNIHVRFRRIFAYAACILLVAGVSFLYLKKDGNEQQLYSNTTGSLMSVILPDSSSVTLYPDARMSYRAEDDRRKTILEGKAFFKVRPDQTRPFTVRNNAAEVRVLGTSFIVNGNDSSETSVFVREGKVQVSSSGKETILNAGEQALVKDKDIIKTETENSELVFGEVVINKVYDNSPVSLVIGDIEKEFNVRIMADEDIMDNRISTTIKFIKLEDILSEISYICNCKYKKTSDKTYKLYKP